MLKVEKHISWILFIFLLALLLFEDNFSNWNEYQEVTGNWDDSNNIFHVFMNWNQKRAQRSLRKNSIVFIFSHLFNFFSSNYKFH